MTSPRQFYVELSSVEATNYDFSTASGGQAGILPDWVEMPNGGTLSFKDGTNTTRALSSAVAGQRYPIQIRKILTSTETVRCGTATAAGLPGPVGAPGADGGGYNVTGVKTGDYTAVAGDFVRVSTASAHTITLPTAVGCDGQKIAVIDSTGAGAGTNNITIATTSAQTINATTPVAIATTRKCVVYISDGANWFILSAS